MIESFNDIYDGFRSDQDVNDPEFTSSDDTMSFSDFEDISDQIDYPWYLALKDQFFFFTSRMKRRLKRISRNTARENADYAANFVVGKAEEVAERIDDVRQFVLATEIADRFNDFIASNAINFEVANSIYSTDIGIALEKTARVAEARDLFQMQIVNKSPVCSTVYDICEGTFEDRLVLPNTISVFTEEPLVESRCKHLDDSFFIHDDSCPKVANPEFHDFVKETDAERKAIDKWWSTERPAMIEEMPHDQLHLHDTIMQQRAEALAERQAPDEFISAEGDLDTSCLKVNLDEAKVAGFWYLHTDYHNSPVDDYICGDTTPFSLYNVFKWFLANKDTANNYITEVKVPGKVSFPFNSDFDLRSDLNAQGPVMHSNPELTVMEVDSHHLMPRLGCTITRKKDQLFSQTLVNNMHTSKLSMWTREPKTVLSAITAGISNSSTVNIPRQLVTLGHNVQANTIEMCMHRYMKSRMDHRCDSFLDF